MSRLHVLHPGPIATALLLATACGGPLRTGTVSKPATKPDPNGACPTGLSVCGIGAFAICVDPQSDRAHCGECDRACTPGIACQAGACQQATCTGEPTFSSQAGPASSAVPSSSREYLVLADINGDGRLDAVQWGADSPRAGTSFYVSLGLPGGGFGEARAYQSELRVQEISVVDVDHDGIDDLALVASVLTCVEEWLGARDGMLKRAPATGVSGCLNTMAMADLSGDGRLDVVAPSKEGSGLAVYLSDSLGVLQLSQVYPTPNQSFRVFVRDWNDDGAPDIVALSETLQLLYNRGDGTFLDVVDCGVHTGDKTTAQAADLDHDGRQDLLMTFPAGVGVLLGQGECRFGPMTSYPAPGSYLQSRVADLDGDGNLDLVVVANPATLLVFLGSPDGRLRPLPPTELGGAMNTGLAIGDINADQRPDVVVTDQTGQTLILENQCP